MKVSLTCAACKGTFLRQECLIRPNQRTFCSRACHVAGQYVDGLSVAGYRIVRIDGKQVYEHRWIMKRHLGRELLASEHVHHINGDKADNRISNLEVLSDSVHHKEHVPLTFDVERAKALYDSGAGYRKLADIFGVARQNIRGAFLRRGWHLEGRTKASTLAVRRAS